MNIGSMADAETRVKPKSKGISITLFYILFIAFIFLQFSLLLYSNLSSQYQFSKEKTEFLIEKEGAILSFELYSKLSSLNYIIGVIADKIAESARNADDISQILTILEKERRILHHDILNWDATFFITANKNIISQNINTGGTALMDYRDDQYLIQSARYLPFRLHFGNVREGIFAAQSIMPAMIGISNQNGEFIGYILTEIALEKLTMPLLKLLHQDMNYVLLDEHINIIATHHNAQGLILDQTITKELMHNKSLEVKKLSTQINYAGYNYHHHITTEKYPFSLLVGYKSTTLKADLQMLVTQNMHFLFLLGIVVISMLLFYCTAIRSAHKLVNILITGKKRSFVIDEFQTLAHSIYAIARHKAELESKNTEIIKEKYKVQKMIEASKHANIFLKNELLHPLKILISAINPKAFRNHSAQMYSHLKDQMQKVISFTKLPTFIDQARTPSFARINILPLIESNLQIFQERILQQNISMTYEFSENIPDIFGDEVILSQMIYNLLYYEISIRNTDSKVKVKVFIRNAAQDLQELVIQFADYGIGMSEEKLEELRQKLEDVDDSQLIYSTDLLFVKYAALIHDGNIQIRSKEGHGTEIIVFLPQFRFY